MGMEIPKIEQTEGAEKDFVVSTAEIPTNKNISKFLNHELEGDLGLFDGDDREIVEKGVRGNFGNLAEKKRFHQIRQSWWFEKYDFPFNEKEARNELLMRKYGPRGETKKVVELQWRLMETYLDGDRRGVKEIRQEYEKDFPGQMEGVTALFEFDDFLEKSLAMNRGEIKSQEERLKIFEEITQYQFLLTNFIKNNTENKEFLKNFWFAWERIAGGGERLKIAHQIKKGILGHVAVFKTMESLGWKPKNAHPKEDAFKSIDIWTENKTPVQVKSVKGMEPLIVESDEVSFPAIKTKNRHRAKILSTKLLGDFSKFRCKIENYGKEIGQDLKGYLVAVPRNKIDFVTGEPAEDFVELMREKMGEIEKGES